MKWEITKDTSFPVLKFDIALGERVKSQSGTMVAMSEGLKLEGKIDGGIGRAIGRMFSGESFFMQHIISEDKPGWVMLASPAPGGITDVDVKDGLTVQKNGFLASMASVEVSTKVQGLARGFFSGEGFFVVKLSGTGIAFLNTYGSIHRIELAAGEEVIVDNGHLIAWDTSMDYKITKAADSWFSALTTGSGFVCHFTGPGRVFMQTRNPWSFGQWAYPYLPIPKRGRK